VYATSRAQIVILIFLVEYEKGGKRFDNFIGLVDFLENALEKDVELVTKEAMSPFILPYIEKEIEYVEIGY
jgi:hypothetical protein